MESKRSRWDSTSPVPQVEAKDAVQEAKDRIAHILRGGQSTGDEVMKEYMINNCPVRHLLTLPSVQREISEKSGAFILTQGKEIDIKDPKAMQSGEKPLCLRISSPDEEKVNKAIELVEEIITRGASGHSYEIKVFVGLDDAPPTYRLVGKVLGPSGQFVKHIARETNTRVQISGKGSQHGDQDEPLHLRISGNSKKSLDAAKELAEDLMKNVRKQYDTFREKREKDRAAGRVQTQQRQQTNAQGYAQMAAYYNQYYQYYIGAGGQSYGQASEPLPPGVSVPSAVQGTQPAPMIHLSTTGSQTGSLPSQMQVVDKNAGQTIPPPPLANPPLFGSTGLQLPAKRSHERRNDDDEEKKRARTNCVPFDYSRR